MALSVTKDSRSFFETGSKRGISADLAARIGRRLDVLEAAQDEWAISVSGNWRITFRFEKGEALDINLEDYH